MAAVSDRVRARHLEIGLAAVQRGFLDLRALAEALLEAGARSVEEVWAPRLTREQLEELAPQVRRTLPLNVPLPLPVPPARARPGITPRSGPRDGVEPTLPTVAPGATEGPLPDLPGQHRYTPIRALGQGGMGEVSECLDRRLGRRIALKRLRREFIADGVAARMIEREARVTGRLEHPGIVPVYDLGHDPETGPYYAMRLLDEPSLDQVLAHLRRGDSDALREYSLARLLRYFVQVCNAVDFAHSRGVVHCDLKPSNVLLGSFGQVLVLDWGLAFLAGEACYRGGTPGYMAPEQLDSTRKSFDARTDVFALGTILYEILTLQPAFPHAAPSGMMRALTFAEPPYTPPPRPRQLSPEVPAELDDIAMTAIALDPKQRLASARELADAIDAFHEGTRERERRAARAAELCAEGDRLAESYLEFVTSRPERVAEIADLRAATPPWEGAAHKRVVWRAEDRLAVTDAMTVRTLQAAATLYEQALDEEPGHPAARRGLGRLYSSELMRAQARRDEVDRIYFTGLLLQYEEHGSQSMREGTLRVEAPPGVPLTLRVVEEHQRRLRATADRALGEAPLPPVALAPGSYELVAGATRQPLFIRSGSETLGAVDLEAAAALPADEVLVPGGPCLLGGHDALEADFREVVVKSFILQRRPVTFGEYLPFLRELDEAARTRYLPRAADGRPYFEPPAPGADGEFGLGRIAEWPGTGAELLAVPVFGVDAVSAEAYAAWWSRRTGRTYRLLTADEWEKAARGVDGRRYPWGDRFDASFCKMRESRAGRPRPEPPGAFADDVSPYGVLDLAGGIADWTTLPGAIEQRRVASRGGAWCDWQADCLLSARRLYWPSERSARVGFRLARTP